MCSTASSFRSVRPVLLVFSTLALGGCAAAPPTVPPATAAAAVAGAPHSEPIANPQELAGVASGVGCEGSSRRSLVNDGGFETTSIPPGGYTLFRTGQPMGGWNVVGAPGNVGPLHTDFTQAGFRFRAHGGQVSLDLTGTSNTPTGVAQTVTTVPGTTYRICFWVGNVVHQGGMFGTTSTVRVLVDGEDLQTATNADGAGVGDLFWRPFTTSFTAKQTSTVITFLNGDPSADTSNFIDDVAMN